MRSTERAGQRHAQPQQARRQQRPGHQPRTRPATHRSKPHSWGHLFVGFCLLAASVGVGATRAQAQDTTAGTANPAPTSTTAAVDRARRQALEQEVGALENQLVDLKAAIPEQQALVEQAGANIEQIDQELVDNQAQGEALTTARLGPEAARQELALTLYIHGPSNQRAMTDFIRTGQLSSDSLRRNSLFEAAEEGARLRLADLAAQARALNQARDQLQAHRAEAVTAEAAAMAQLAETERFRDQSLAALDRARTELKGVLALAVRSPLSGAVDYPLRPAIGVKIDNSSEARPQTGLTKADIVYDIIVEGGITRLLVVFQSTDAARIGPVRSARTSDISIMAGFNMPIFAYSGGNDGVLAAVREAPMISMTESSQPAAFVRDEGRFAPHNLYTSTAGLYRAGGEEAGVPKAQFQFRDPGEPSALGRAASAVSVNIGFESVTYSWNGASWDRATNGVPTADTTAGQVSPQNVIVQFTNYSASPADASSPDALTVGSGDVWILTDGKIIEGRWARSSATTPVQYLDANNNQIPLSPGQTWVELPRPGGAAVS